MSGRNKAEIEVVEFEELDFQPDGEPILDEMELPLDEKSEGKKLRAALIAILGSVPCPTLFRYLWNSRRGINEYSSSKALVALYSDLLTFNLLVLPIILTQINNIPADSERTALTLTMFWVAYLRYILLPVGFSMVDQHGPEIKELFEDALGIVGLIFEELEVPDEYYGKISFGTDKYDMDLSAFSSKIDHKGGE